MRGLGGLLGLLRWSRNLLIFLVMFLLIRCLGWLSLVWTLFRRHVTLATASVGGSLVECDALSCLGWWSVELSCGEGHEACASDSDVVSSFVP